MRGTLGRGHAVHPERRFIPAGAGNATLALLEPHFDPVHPRGCGERRRVAKGQALTAGSSPRVRGTRRPPLRGAVVGRFIPAGAGNAESPSDARLMQAVHPRGCGERSAWARHSSMIAGSSPRVRGTLARDQVQQRFDRFIPAGAGNAAALTSRTCCAVVHPRGCGERRAFDSDVPETAGSSPRVRGTLPEPVTSVRLPQVHPRGCGERSRPPPTNSRRGGSSPRVRGTRLFLPPAGAG